MLDKYSESEVHVEIVEKRPTYESDSISSIGRAPQNIRLRIKTQ